ncbi:hypothetical protein PPTG_19832, partial [Phytophthora nicotianae INRA-310]
MVKPRGKIPRDTEVTGRDLRNDGWTRKPPPRSSLDDRYKYIRPEGHPNGTVGLITSWGRLPYLTFMQMLPQMKNLHTLKPLRSLNAILLDRQPVAHLRRLRSSIHRLRVHHLSFSAYPEENNNDASGASAEVHTGDEDNEDDFDTLGSELLADKHDNLNAVEPGESADQYGAIESGDEAEKDDVDADEYDSDQDVEGFCTPEDLVDDVDEMEAEIAEEALFAANFLGGFGGADEVLAANLQNIVLRSLSAMGWEDVVEPNIDEHMMGPYHPVSNTGSYP